MDERLYWLGFSVFPKIGPKRFSELLQRFETAKSAWNAGSSELRDVLGPALTEKFVKFRTHFSPETYQNELLKKGVQFVILSDKAYPELLKKISNSPFVLYVKGDISMFGHPGGSKATDRISNKGDSIATLQNDKFIGVVGTRKITSYGRSVTEMITGELSDAGFIVVSGLALGVDSVAHATTIAHNGKTIAVLGCGVDCCTPAANQALYNSIVDGSGAVISEFPLGMLPTKGSFPSRNRIIAGLSQAVIVTEGAEDSGSLITASKALEFGRPVFAVPGPITSSLSRGPNKLLSEGAKFVTSGGDILRELGIKGIKSTKGIKGIKGDTKEEQKIIDLLQNEPLHFDEIVKRAGLESSETGTLLSLMEMKGMIKNENNGQYALVLSK